MTYSLHMARSSSTLPYNTSGRLAVMAGWLAWLAGHWLAGWLDAGQLEKVLEKKKKKKNYHFHEKHGFAL